MRTVSRRGGPRGLVATIATVVAAGCLSGGLALVSIALAAQHPAGGMPPRSTPPGEAAARTPTEPEDLLSWWLPEAARLPEAPAPPEAAVPAVPTTLAPSKPVSLAIPSIDVDSAVQHLGQDASGALEVPRPGPHYDEAAWYRYSPTPGELGPAVLLGHIDSAANGPSVFFRLGELPVGEQVFVTRADGSTAVFTVDAVHRYPKDAFPTELVYGDIDHAGLRILTCGGAFDRATRSYVDNIVVFASLTHSGNTAVSARLR